MTIWINGSLHKGHGPLIDTRDRGLLLADGVFETILIREGKPVFLREHLERFRRAAEFFGIPMGYTDEKINDAIRRVVASHGPGNHDYACRITLTRGVGQRGLVPPEKSQTLPTLMITAAKSAPVMQDQVVLSLSDICRNEGSPSSRYKTIAYTDNILARQRALQEGAGDALMCNNNGEVACATAANIFLILPGGKLVTPPREVGVLGGIARGVVLDIAVSVFTDVREVVLRPGELGGGQLFLTNSLIGIQLARMIGDTKQASGETRDLLLELQKRYAQRISDDIRGQ
ncbi:MAG: aminotransferase class IV [Aquisalinus sp.]|nr:aminotransferase class IV [Aquisalinus sp.]